MKLERYLKQTIIPQIGTVGQKKLLNSHILIVGGGGLAVPVVQYLAGAGIGTISVIDGDKVSLDNLHRQTLFKEKDIGNFKVDVLKKFVKNLNSSINLNTFNFYANPSNIYNLCSKVDVIVDCADNFATTFFLSDLCLERKICFITASVSLFSGYVGTFCNNAPSVRAVFPDLPSNNKSCNTEGVLGTSVGMIGSLQAQLVIFYLLKINKTINKLIDNKLIISGGGHDEAGGFTAQKEHLSDIEDFLINEFKTFKSKSYSYFDAFTIFPKKNSSIINDLKSLEPFGKDNPEPIFYFKNIKSIKSKIINKRHVQNILKNKSGRSIKSISFDCVNSELGKYLLNFKKEFDLIGSIVENNWNNKKDLELRVIDIIQKT